MSRLSIRFLILIFFILISFTTQLTGSLEVLGNDAAYDEQEAVRRAARQLMEIDRAQKEAARKRYDATHSNYSSTDDKSCEGVLCCVGLIVVLAIAGAVSAKKQTEQKVLKNIESENKKRPLDECLAIAESIGFSCENETKECPACAEKIKIKAKICRYCRKEFSDEEVEKSLQTKLNEFIASHKRAE